jgi:FtsH-binding integral membrane protein
MIAAKNFSRFSVSLNSLQRVARSWLRRATYAFVGAVLGAIINLAINLLAAAIQQRPLGASVLQHNVDWLIGLIVGGLVLGLWLSARVQLQPNDSRATPQTSPQHRVVQPITMTRLRALLSYGRLRGQGIALTDIMLWGSVLDIDTRK